MNPNVRTLIIGGSVLIGAVGLFLVARSIMKKVKAKKTQQRTDMLAQELGQTQTSQQTQESQASSGYNPANHVKLISGYIKGANFWDYGDEVDAIFNGLTDAQLKKLDAEWRKQNKGETLYYWLDDEMDNCGFWGVSNCYESAMNRLKSLGLSS